MDLFILVLDENEKFHTIVGRRTTTTTVNRETVLRVEFEEGQSDLRISNPRLVKVFTNYDEAMNYANSFKKSSL